MIEQNMEKNNIKSGSFVLKNVTLCSLIIRNGEKIFDLYVSDIQTAYKFGKRQLSYKLVKE